MLNVADVKMQVYKQMTDMLKVADVKMQVYKQMTRHVKGSRRKDASL